VRIRRIAGAPTVGLVEWADWPILSWQRQVYLRIAMGRGSERRLLRGTQLALLVSCAAGVAVAAAILAPTSSGAGARNSVALCSSSYVGAIIGGESKCLRNGEFCSPSYASDYVRYGFACVAGRLTTGTAPNQPPLPIATAKTTVSLGKTVLLAQHSKTSNCKHSVEPDRRCSPGAYSNGLTMSVICATSFRTGTIRNVPESEKHAIELEYGMPARSYGRTIEIDHIVSLELGGSNDIANLFPEPGTGAANYHVKDRLENRLHAMVCSGAISPTAARRQIAGDWVALYRRVFGSGPTG
jgi:hypothetical protein